MQPANVDPVECARRIVYAYASGAPDEVGSTRCAPADITTAGDDLQQLAGLAAQPFFPPNLGVTLVCVLLSAAIVAWSIATP